MEKRMLQLAVTIGSLVPITAGAAGVIWGPHMATDDPGIGGLDSHFRYLSGLLLGIGIAYASAIPRIEAASGQFLLLTSIVLVGGFGRLVSLWMAGSPSWATIGALAMELLVTPGLTLWQRRVAAQADRTRA